MSGLAALLAGRKEPGIFRWHGAFDVETVRHTVEHAGWHFGWVDGWHEETSDEFLAGCSEALNLPEGSDKSFDALADGLQEVGSDGSGTVLLWDGHSPFCRHDDQAFSVALSVLGGRVNADRGGPFVVLLRGEGPDVPGVASID
jgi:Barstar (barnase inhibitor)